MIELDFVVAIHDEIISEFEGLPGFAGGGLLAVQSALVRIDNYAHYSGLDDVLGIAALYAEAIACGHVFNDGNKRTGLACAVSYMEQQGFHVPKNAVLEELMVKLAKREIDREEFAFALGEIAGLNGAAIEIEIVVEGGDTPKPEAS